MVVRGLGWLRVSLSVTRGATRERVFYKFEVVK